MIARSAAARWSAPDANSSKPLVIPLMNLQIPKKSDLLARAYLDMLGADAGTNGSPLLRSGNPDDPIELLIDDLTTAPQSAGRTSIRADLAAAAVLVARAIEKVDGLTRELRRDRPVVSMTTHGADIVALVRQVLKACAFGSEAKALDDKSFDDGYTRPVLLLARDGTANDHKSDRGNDAIAKALHAGAPIFGVAPDPRRHLPRDLLRAADSHLSLNQLDASAIALVVEAVTGSVPTVLIDDRLVRAVDVSDLALSIRADRSADECIGRLEKIVSNKNIFDHHGPCLEELAGYGAAREFGLNLIADLRLYRAGLLDWGSLSEKGLLLVGPPGTGKTQFFRALSKSLNVPLIATSVANWNSANYLSGTLQQIKACFAQARQLAPAVLFIDELDGISSREFLANSEHREFWTQIVNLLLEMMSEENTGVILCGASNFPDRIDPAIRRSGRLDRTIEIELPDAESLAQIFRFHLGPDILSTVDLMPAALAATGGTGADVEAWVRRAKSRARREHRELTFDDLLHEIRGGQEGLPDVLRRVCSLHEAGHLVVGVALDVFEPRALTIFDEGGTTLASISRANHQTEFGIENLIAMLLSGRAAEEVVLGSSQRTVGAGVGETNSDLARATQCAIDLELRYGFGVLGPVRFSERAIEMLLRDASVVGLVKKRLDKCGARARDLIERNREAVEAIAKRLEATGYLDGAAIGALLQQYPVSAEAAQ